MRWNFSTVVHLENFRKLKWEWNAVATYQFYYEICPKGTVHPSRKPVSYGGLLSISVLFNLIATLVHDKNFKDQIKEQQQDTNIDICFCCWGFNFQQKTNYLQNLPTKKKISGPFWAVHIALLWLNSKE